MKQTFLEDLIHFPIQKNEQNQTTFCIKSKKINKIKLHFALKAKNQQNQTLIYIKMHKDIYQYLYIAHNIYQMLLLFYGYIKAWIYTQIPPSNYG